MHKFLIILTFCVLSVAPQLSWAVSVESCQKLESGYQSPTQLELLKKEGEPRQLELFEHSLSGVQANKSGLHFECALLEMFENMGFTAVKESVYEKNKRKYDKEKLVLMEAHYHTIYGRDGYTEFVLVRPGGERVARIEAKFQSHKGSTDHKSLIGI